MRNLRNALFALPVLLATQAQAGSDPLIGEIMWTAFGFCPPNWIIADGRLLNISDRNSQPLYSLIGTQFGGDGIKTFAVPDLRGTTAVGYGQKQGDNFLIGQYRQGYGCPQGQQCPTNGTSSLTLMPCIAIQGSYPQRP